jgi:electron-transferring-flavoprotein dehydrogenase
VDVLLVGAGPANLACAIHLQRLLKEKGAADKTILVLEKGAEIGDHTLSGAVMNPRGMAELFPDWRERGCPIDAEVTWDGLEVMLPKGKSRRLTGLLVPPQLKNRGKVIVSMNYAIHSTEGPEAAGSRSTRAAAEALPRRRTPERVAGVVTRDAGIDKHGEKKGQQAGMIVRAPVTVFGEGPRGHLAKHLVKRHQLDAGKNPQTYGTGIKELWEITPERGAEWKGRVLHTMGYPHGTEGYRGGWVYGLDGNRLSIGYVVGLDHHDAKLDPHALFVRWKQHPAIAGLLEGGKVLRYGAKTVPEGGYFAMPKLFGGATSSSGTQAAS